MLTRTVTIRPLAGTGTGTDTAIDNNTAIDLEAVLPLMSPDPASPLSAASYREKLAARQYRPEWTWLAVDDASGAPLAVAVWWGSAAESEPGALDALCVQNSVPAEERIDLAAAVLRAGHESFAAASGSDEHPRRDHPDPGRRSRRPVHPLRHRSDQRPDGGGDGAPRLRELRSAAGVLCYDVTI